MHAMPVSDDAQKPSVLSSSHRFADIRILICDPDYAIGVLVKNVISALGVRHVFIVPDGLSALDLMKREPIDIIITDWDMSPMNGLDLTLHLRKSLDSPNRMIPVIMLTARKTRPDIQRARDAGVTEYMIKPFTSGALIERLQDIAKDPRGFVLSPNYTGPDRRRIRTTSLPPDPDTNPHYYERTTPLMVGKEALNQLILDDMPRIVVPDYSLSLKAGFDVPDILLDNPQEAEASSPEERQQARAEFLQMIREEIDAMERAYESIAAGANTPQTSLKKIEDSAFIIKARAGLFGYVRAAEVAGQLLNFCRRHYDMRNLNHQIIVEKHIQAIAAIVAQNITGDGGEIGKALIIDLARLMHKYLSNIHVSDAGVLR